jgi:hypothetical protein
MCSIATSFTPTHQIHEFWNIFVVPASTNASKIFQQSTNICFPNSFPSLDEPHVQDSENAYHLGSPKYIITGIF